MGKDMGAKGDGKMTNKPEPGQMKRWEYSVEPMRRCCSPGGLYERLNHLGKEGWELCLIQYGCLILKRQEM